jgi:4-hydroxybenzoate polyprenyltransferase
MAERAAIAFLCMSLCASAIYVVNDLSDAGTDRMHRSKFKRPFASGTLPHFAGLLIAPLAFASGILLSLLLPRPATVVLLMYAALALAYTFWLRQKLLADVIALSLLYAMRIVEGGTAMCVLVSPWLLAFSLFLLLSFAFSKRVTEMLQSTSSIRSLPGRGYLVSDTPIIASLGTASGCLACLVLSFYINGDAAYKLYPHPEWLWFLVPLLLYWIGRFWVLTMRGEMRDDPILFVLKDSVTRISLACGAIIVTLAMTTPSGIPGIIE